MDRWQELWSGLTTEDRKQAAIAFWEGDDEEETLAEAIFYLSEQLRFRVQTLVKLPVAKRADYLARARQPPPRVIRDALRKFHLQQRSPMLCRFLDDLGIPHEGGMIERGDDDPPAPAEADIRRAAQVLVREFPVDQVKLYFRILRLQDEELWAGLAAADQMFAAPAPSLPPAEPTIEEEAEREDLSEVRRARTFRHLDRVVIRTIIDSVAGVEGALLEDQVRDLVEEIVHLNQERHQSYFHLGLLDVLQDHPVRTDWPESNESRRLWYLSGVLSGFARRNDLESSRKFIRERMGELRPLGRGEHPASGLAVPLIWKALSQGAERSGALALVTADGLVEAGPAMLGQALDDATELLREVRSEEARPVLDAVVAAASELERRGQAMPPAFMQKLRRRQAHTRRLAGDFDGAAALLRELMGGGAGEYEGMVLADLGLVACRVRSLAEVRAPDATADWRAEAERLSPGLEHFRRATAANARRGGHGEYCLGVYHLLRGELDLAGPLLDRAHGQMQASPDVYEAQGVLARVRLYLARCLAEQGSALQPRRVRELLGLALPRLRKEALGFLEPILTALGLTDEETASQVAAYVFGLFGAEAIDAIASSEMLRKLPEARAALRERAATSGRPRRDRSADYERALKASLRAGDRAGAEAALDGIEDMANDEPVRGLFLELLDDPDRHGDVWDEDELDHARFRLCDRARRFDEAVAALERLGHRLVSRGDESSMEEARDLVDRVRAYGREPDPQLVARLAALRPAEVAAPAAAEMHGRIFVIGGNEVQATYDRALREWAARRWPGVELDIEHPGWSSNWGRQVDSWAERLAGADAVVLMRFVRTQLGRTIRARCGEHETPWIPCTGHGRASIERAIERAVQLLPRAGTTLAQGGPPQR